MARLTDLFLLSKIPSALRGRSTQPSAAMLLFLLVLLPANLAAADSPELWTLKRIVVANGMNQFATITDEHYDANGGEVDVSGDGRALDLCSGGFERLHFKWRFPQDITRVSNGGTLSVALEAGPAGRKEPCNGGIAAISESLSPAARASASRFRTTT